MIAQVAVAVPVAAWSVFALGIASAVKAKILAEYAGFRVG
jgi:hypothetical protein